jgi:hypothetical protein
LEFLVRQPNHKANNRGKKKTDVIEKYKLIPKILLSAQFLSNLPTRLTPEATVHQNNAQSDLSDIEKKYQPAAPRRQITQEMRYVILFRSYNQNLKTEKTF